MLRRLTTYIFFSLLLILALIILVSVVAPSTISKQQVQLLVAMEEDKFDYNDVHISILPTPSINLNNFFTVDNSLNTKTLEIKVGVSSLYKLLMGKLTSSNIDAVKLEEGNIDLALIDKLFSNYGIKQLKLQKVRVNGSFSQNSKLLSPVINADINRSFMGNITFYGSFLATKSKFEGKIGSEISINYQGGKNIITNNGNKITANFADYKILEQDFGGLVPDILLNIIRNYNQVTAEAIFDDFRWQNINILLGGATIRYNYDNEQNTAYLLANDLNLLKKDLEEVDFNLLALLVFNDNLIHPGKLVLKTEGLRLSGKDSSIIGIIDFKGPNLVGGSIAFKSQDEHVVVKANEQHDNIQVEVKSQINTPESIIAKLFLHSSLINNVDKFIDELPMDLDADFTVRQKGQEFFLTSIKQLDFTSGNKNLLLQYDEQKLLLKASKLNFDYTILAHFWNQFSDDFLYDNQQDLQNYLRKAKKNRQIDLELNNVILRDHLINNLVVNAQLQPKYFTINQFNYRDKYSDFSAQGSINTNRLNPEWHLKLSGSNIYWKHLQKYFKNFNNYTKKRWLDAANAIEVNDIEPSSSNITKMLGKMSLENAGINIWGMNFEQAKCDVYFVKKFIFGQNCQAKLWGGDAEVSAKLDKENSKDFTVAFSLSNAMFDKVKYDMLLNPLSMNGYFSSSAVIQGNYYNPEQVSPTLNGKMKFLARGFMMSHNPTDKIINKVAQVISYPPAQNALRQNLINELNKSLKAVKNDKSYYNLLQADLELKGGVLAGEKVLMNGRYSSGLADVEVDFNSASPKLKLNLTQEFQVHNNFNKFPINSNYLIDFPRSTIDVETDITNIIDQLLK